MINYRHLLNIRQIAIHNTMCGDLDFYIEKCYKHYSKTYHTPLHIAKELIPMEEVIKVFMEDELEDFTPEDMADFKAKVDETPKLMLAAPTYTEESEELSEELWIAQQNALLKQQDEKAKKQQADIIKQTHEALDKLTTSLTNVTEKKPNVE